jgi:hypothetical protein
MHILFAFVHMHLLLHLLLLASCILPAFLHPSSRRVPRISPSAESECSSEGDASAAAVSSPTLATVVASHSCYSSSSDDTIASVSVHKHKYAALKLRDSIIVFHTSEVLLYRM